MSTTRTIPEVISILSAQVFYWKFPGGKHLTVKSLELLSKLDNFHSGFRKSRFDQICWKLETRRPFVFPRSDVEFLVAIIKEHELDARN